jgi:hypothetical protein
MIEVILAWIKHRGIRVGDFPGFHFIPSGLLFPSAAWIVPHRPCLAAKQVGRGFWRVVRFQEKCRLDERSVIRQTTNCAIPHRRQNGSRPQWVLGFSSLRTKFPESIVTWADEVIR